jgi:hypothetical protein
VLRGAGKAAARSESLVSKNWGVRGHMAAREGAVVHREEGVSSTRAGLKLKEHDHKVLGRLQNDPRRLKE